MPDENFTTFEDICTNIGLVVMGSLIFDSNTKQELPQEVREMSADIKTAIIDLSDDERNEALYFYEKSIGKRVTGKAGL